MFDLFDEKLNPICLDPATSRAYLEGSPHRFFINLKDTMVFFFESSEVKPNIDIFFLSSNLKYFEVGLHDIYGELLNML